MRIFKSSMCSGNFDFEAFAETADQAERLILKAWKKHTKEYGVPNSYRTIPELYSWFGIHTFEVSLNSAYRDGDKI